MMSQPNLADEAEVQAPEDPFPTPVSSDSDSSEGEGFIHLSRKELHKEIERLQKEDPDFANAFNTQVGRKAATRAIPRIAELEAITKMQKRELRAAEISAMDHLDIVAQFI